MGAGCRGTRRADTLLALVSVRTVAKPNYARVGKGNSGIGPRLVGTKSGKPASRYREKTKKIEGELEALFR
jgi:hypothetical protein